MPTQVRVLHTPDPLGYNPVMAESSEVILTDMRGRPYLQPQPMPHGPELQAALEWLHAAKGEGRIWRDEWKHLWDIVLVGDEPRLRVGNRVLDDVAWMPESEDATATDWTLGPMDDGSSRILESLALD